MDRCESCRNLMLEYLYDLLDEAELQPFVEHLTGCAACQAQLEKAKAQQRLLAAAAKKQFPAVQFEAPPVTVPAPIAPASGRNEGGIQRSPRSFRAVARWAVAAGVLVAAVGLTLPGARHWNEYATARKAVETHQMAMADTRRALNETAQQISSLHQKQAARQAAIDAEVREQRLKLEVSGPQAVQSGAPNEYLIRAKNYNDKKVPARVDVRIRDQANRVVFEKDDIEIKEEYRLLLPRDLPLPPNGTLAMEVTARREGGPASRLHQQLELAAPLYLTHLTTDKPMYQPGEVVRFRSLTLERFSLKPAQEAFQLVYTVKRPTGEEFVVGRGNTGFVQGENGGQLLGPDKQPIRGVGAGEFPLDGASPGGEYTLTVRDAANRFPPQERKFIVNRYQPPRLRKELDFARKSFGPGEEVAAVCKAERAEGGAVAGRPVEATVLIDDKTYGADGKESASPIRLQTDAQGKVEVRFRLPAAIEKGDASLSVKFNDGGSIEAITRPIPIVLKKLQVEFFPEGGDLVAGVPNRVYFQVRSPLGKPADLKGRIVDQDGNVVVEKVETLSDKEHPGVNQGQGLFAFTPQADTKYELKIDAPAHIEGRHPLPEVKKDGVVLSIPEGVFRSDEPIRVVVYNAGEERALLVGGYCRGRMLDHQPVTVQKNDRAEVVLKPAASVGGVYRVTVFEKVPGPGVQHEFVPRAERLVYRKPLERLELALHADRKPYVPGDKATIHIAGVTEDDVPAPAILMVKVVDKSVLNLADEKTARSMPAHFYMTTEVRRGEDLEYADFLLTTHPRAKEALDLLLGTQGWRRFAEQDPEKFREKFHEEAARLLVGNGQYPRERPWVAEGQLAPETIAFERAAKQKVAEEIQQERAALAARLGEEQRQLNDEQNAPDYRAALAVVSGYRQTGETLRKIGVPLLGLALVVIAVGCLVVGIQRGLARGIVPLATCGICGLLFLGLVAFELATQQANSPFSLVGSRVRRDAAADNEAVAMKAELDMKVQEAAEGAAVPGDAGPLEVADRAPAPPVQPGAPLDMPRATASKPATPGGLTADDLLKQMNKMKPGDGRELLKEAKGDAKRPNERQFARFGHLDGIRKDEADKDALAGKEREAERLRRAIDRGEAAFGDRGGEGRGPGMPFVVRQYAHRHVPAKGGERSDYAETVYWHPVLVLPDGKADISFDLSDAVTTFEVTAFGHTLDGRLGAVSTTIESRLPFTLEPKVPIEMTAGDKIDIPVSIANNTNQQREVQVKVEYPGLKLLAGKEQDRLTLGGEERARRIFRFQPSIIEGPASVLFEGKTEPFAADKVRRNFTVVPEGFPVAGARSDMLEGVARNDIILPETWVPGTLKLQVQVYPSTLASLQKGLESLLREPHGCFEQTSTSNYPNVLILDYLRENDLAKPDVDRRARELLGKGYQKLTSFECQNTAKNKKEGYEWFGGTAPAHEALTAYGLLQFRDMSRVFDVDPAMVERTRQYLMSQRDGQGGFRRNPRALDTFGRAPEHITNAYIVWALTESGKDDDLEKELSVLAAQAKGSKDPYFVSLVANSLLNRSKSDEGVALLKAVAAAQKPDGHLDAEKTSITGSGGQSLQIETTALAMLGWLKANRPADFNLNVQNAVKWIGQQRGNYGGFGSTQSTILALKALIAYTKANKRPAEAGELKLFVGEQEVAKLAFGTDASDALTLNLADAEKHLKPGKNALRVEMTGKNVFPYTLAWSYQTLKPASAEGCAVRLGTRLGKTKADEGDAVRLTVTLENVSGKGQGMAVAIVGLPAGLSVPENFAQLKDHCRLWDNDTKPGLISAFELRGRELVLYWRDLAPEQKIEVPIDLECRVPGEYRGPASRAYLYYNPDVKHWIDPLQMTIQAKAE
jgi:hypothetical protein